MSTTTNSLTAEEFFERADSEHCELVRGEVTCMSPASGYHSEVAAILHALLGYHVLEHELGRTYIAEGGFLIERKPDTVLVPDVSFVSKARLPEWSRRKKFMPVVPDLAVEVVSPSDRMAEVDRKARRWIEAGCSMVCVVDPESETVRNYHADGTYSLLERDAKLDGGDLIPGWSLRIGRLFIK